MSGRFKYYAIVGNNGYGLTSNWQDIVDYAKHFENEWHKGFNTEDDAYNWILLQAAMRHNLNQNGICNLETLHKEKFIFLDDNYKNPHMQKRDKEQPKSKPAKLSSVEKEMFDKFLTWMDEQRHHIN